VLQELSVMVSYPTSISSSAKPQINRIIIERLRLEGRTRAATAQHLRRKAQTGNRSHEDSADVANAAETLAVYVHKVVLEDDLFTEPDHLHSSKIGLQGSLTTMPVESPAPGEVAWYLQPVSPSRKKESAACAILHLARAGTKSWAHLDVAHYKVEVVSWSLLALDVQVPLLDLRGEKGWLQFYSDSRATPKEIQQESAFHLGTIHLRTDPLLIERLHDWFLKVSDILRSKLQLGQLGEMPGHLARSIMTTGLGFLGGTSEAAAAMEGSSKRHRAAGMLGARSKEPGSSRGSSPAAAEKAERCNRKLCITGHWVEVIVRI